MGLHGRERHGAGVRSGVLFVGSGYQRRESGRARARSADARGERAGGVVVGIRELLTHSKLLRR